MHDNARPHVARTCQQFLDRNNVNVLIWPAVSQDLNPIEHIWNYLGRKVQARGSDSQRRYQTLPKDNARLPCCLHQ